MLNVTDFIVWLWFLPVTLFILLPLAMLSVWVVAKILMTAARAASSEKAVAPARSAASIASSARA